MTATASMPSLKDSQIAEDSQAIISHEDSANPNPTNFSPRTLTRNHKTISKRSPPVAEYDAQGEPPQKRQRKCRVQGDTAIRDRPIRKAQGLLEVARANHEYGTMVIRSDLKRDGVRGSGKFLEWFDKNDDQWKSAGYHSEYRAGLLALAAQQPGAPFYSEHMGTDHTSFSPLTQGWNADPDSVIDYKGRRVFSLKKNEAGWTGRAQYGPLIYNGRVMLDHKENPVRDVPGLPLTLQTEAPAWLLAGLRRCMDLTIDDLMARRPTTRETLSGTKKNTGNTSLTQSMSRWLQLENIEEWNPRQKSKKKKQQHRAATPDHQGLQTMEEQVLPPAQAGPDLNDLHGGFSIAGSHFSTEIPRQPVISPYDQYYNGQQSTVSPVLGENDRRDHYEPYLGGQNFFTHDPHAFFANEACPPVFPYQTTARSIEDHDRPNGYRGQMFPTLDTASAYEVPSSSSISNYTPYGLFAGGEHVYIDETQVHLRETVNLRESPPALAVVDPILSEFIHL